MSNRTTARRFRATRRLHHRCVEAFSTASTLRSVATAFNRLRAVSETNTPANLEAVDNSNAKLDANSTDTEVEASIVPDVRRCPFVPDEIIEKPQEIAD